MKRLPSRHRSKLGWVPIALYLLALVPPGVAFHSVARQAVNVPVWDEWEFPLLMTRLEAGEITVPEIAWLQRGEHRKVFPHLIILASAYLTDYNVVVHIYLALLMRLVALWMVWRLLIRGFGPPGSAGVAALTSVSSFLFFSAAESENWMWGESAIMIGLINLSVVALVWALDRWPLRWRGFLPALAATIVGAFSAASGLLLPAVGLTGIALYNRTLRGVWLDRRAAAWLSSSIVLTALYFLGWERRFQTAVDLVPGVEMFRHHLLFTLSYLGAPLQIGSGVVWAAVAGALGVLALVFHLFSPPARSSRSVPWALLALFAFATAFLTSIGRSGFGLEQASRYTGIACLFWVATTAVVALTWPATAAGKVGSVRRVLTATALVFLAAGYFQSFARGHHRVVERGAWLAEKEVYLRHYETAGASLRGLYPRRELLYPRLTALASLDMGVFSDPTRTENRRLFAEPPIQMEVRLSLVPGQVVTQDFVGRCGELTSLSLPIESATVAWVRLEEEAADRLLFDGEVDLAAEAGWARIDLSAPSDRSPKRYRLTISNPSPTRELVLWRSNSDALPDGALRISGHPVEGDLVFRYGCAPLRPGVDYPLDLSPGFPPRKVAWHRAVVAGDGRETLFMVPPAAEATWWVQLPASGRATLETSLVVSSRTPSRGDADEGWSGRPPPGDGAVFRVTVESPGQAPVELLNRRVDPWSRQEDRRFIPVTLGLGPWAGRSFQIRLATDPGPAGNSGWDLAGWVEPRIVVANDPD